MSIVVDHADDHRLTRQALNAQDPAAGWITVHPTPSSNSLIDLAHVLPAATFTVLGQVQALFEQARARRPVRPEPPSRPMRCSNLSTDTAVVTEALATPLPLLPDSGLTRFRADLRRQLGPDASRWPMPCTGKRGTRPARSSPATRTITPIPCRARPAAPVRWHRRVHPPTGPWSATPSLRRLGRSIQLPDPAAVRQPQPCPLAGPSPTERVDRLGEAGHLGVGRLRRSGGAAERRSPPRR
ncbi:hypothetical protein [Nonomuraea sp. NPDC001831]|uniref:hypothetical protein n=1 Tax=Nonomuraea sp. NPDC001831 TaxID=3364340 RepID=UPI003693E456